MTATSHTNNSSFRENLIEHLFIGELLKLSWIKYNCELEVSKPDVDNSGYDIIVESGKAIRHIQLKSSYRGGKTSRQNIHMKLCEKPAGCVVWVYFDDDTLTLGPFYFLGSPDGKSLTSLEDHKIAKHTKADTNGIKSERQNIRVVNKGEFTLFKSIEELYEALF